MSERARVVVQNVNVPGRRSTLDAEKYGAMRAALLAVLPAAPPGLSQAEMIDAVRAVAPERLWPGGEKVAWWMKSVQLDLEAKGVVIREATKPLRWHRASQH